MSMRRDTPALHAFRPGCFFRLRHQGGMTLIELMVSMVIGLFLTWGAFQVYLQSKDNFRAAEVTTRLQENTRFALETIEPDLRLAGFWGLHSEFSLIIPPVGVAVSCDGDEVTAWALALDQPVQTSDDTYDLPCPAFGEGREGSDVLVIRHAGEMTRAPEAGQLQIQSNLARAQLFDDGAVPPGFAGDTETRDVLVHAYYVDNRSSFSEDIPSLRRLTLIRGGVIEDQEMISGVENLQIQYGLDTNGDGSVERYVDADDAGGGAGDIRAVRLWILLRSEDSPGPVYRDEREYQPLDADLAPIVPGDDLYPAQFQRMELTKTIVLRNRVTG